MVASVLTNTAAMVALQTLRTTNNSLETVNSQISTGKKVATAKDNAAVFAISKVMESDVSGFKAISESLALGESTTAVAANAAESIGTLLNEIKGKIISANEDNVDRQKLQDEIVQLRGQISSIVSSAQFNGLNLIDGSTDGTAGFSVLSSLDRDSTGTVTTSNISFDPTNSNLSTSSGTDLIAGTNPATTETITTAAFATPDVGLGSADIAATARGFGLDNASAATAGFVLGDFEFLDASGATGGGVALAPEDVDLSSGSAQDGLVAGDKITFNIGNTTAIYTVKAGDRSSDVIVGVRNALVENGLNESDFSLDTSAGTQITVTNLTEQEVNGFYQITRASGGLAGLDSIDVSTQAGAASAVSQVENFIQNAVDAQAQLGTIEKRLEIQSDFMSTLIDSFKSGIGSLVDADLEEASARLQALQVQQQLGIQALSIANQAPQNILALFR